jgi:hypothetical protein
MIVPSADVPAVASDPASEPDDRAETVVVGSAGPVPGAALGSSARPARAVLILAILAIVIGSGPHRLIR